MEHLAHYDKKYLIKQNKKNTCLLTSVYNAFPILFDYDENKYIELNNKSYTPNMIKELFGEDKISIIDKPELPLKENILTEIKSSINNQQPIIAGFTHYPGLYHAISFFGYNDDMLYYFESGKENTLVVNIITCIEYILNEYYSIQKLSIKQFEEIGMEWYYELRQRMRRNGSKEYTNEIINGLVKSKIYNYRNGLSAINEDLITEDTLVGWCLIKYRKHIEMFDEHYFKTSNGIILKERLDKIRIVI